VFSAVAMAVAWGRERIDLTGITAIGVDEIHWSTKQGFMTLEHFPKRLNRDSQV